MIDLHVPVVAFAAYSAFAVIGILFVAAVVIVALERANRR